MRIAFYPPDTNGMLIKISGDVYALSDNGEKIINRIDELARLKSADSKVKEITFTDCPILMNENRYSYLPITFSFAENTLTVKYKEKAKTYEDVTFDYFYDGLMNSFRKYSRYWASPCNYKIFFFKSYEDMIKEFEDDEIIEEEKKITSKLSQYGY